MNAGGGRPVPKEILLELTRWRRQAGVLRVAHLVLGSATIVFSVIVASQIRSLNPDIVSWLAAGSAIAAGLLTGFDLGSKANRMRNAWRNLNTAVMQFQEDPSYTVETLISVYSKSEALIGDVKEEPK
jgi:hypothetical protein